MKFKKLDLKVGFSCNNNCIFCAQAHKRNLGDKTTEQLKKDLEEGIIDGCNQVVFTGGEPTIRKDIFELVKYASDLGYHDIQIQTNGRMLSYMKFAKQMVKAGATEFSPALHGHTAKIHEIQTRAPGSFNQTVQAIKNLVELDQYVLTNSVVTKFNYRYLPELVQLLINLDVDQLQLAFVHPCGNAGKNFDKVVPKKSDVEPFIHKALDIGKSSGKLMMVEAFPFCFMKGYEKYCSERFMPPGEVIDIGMAIKNFDKWRKEKGKAKSEKCKKCKYNLICEGPWKEYIEHYGWDEFKPVPGKMVKKI